jgi:two-component system, cell cycle sensor histidine kinase and response regulator CckA
MTKPLPVAHMIPSQRVIWILLVALLVLGLLGNYFKYPLFFEIDFLFGSIFSFLILQFFGKAYGIGAALLVSGVTYFIWGHPYALIIMTAELTFVALLTGRYKISLVFADAAYWLLLGMPLVYVFYHGVMGVSETVTNVTLTKQAVNGITNVLIARLIFILIGFRAPVFSITLREVLHTCMVLCVALPMLILIIIDSKSDFAKGIAQTQVHLKDDALKINKSIQLWLKNREAGLKNLASIAQLGDSASTQVALDQYRSSDLNVLRVGLISPSFISTLYSPKANEQGRSNVGVDFSDRSFVPLLREQARPVLSDIMEPRLGSNLPIVAYLHPVTRDSQVKGYISGVLSLEQVKQLIDDQIGGSALHFTLLDRSGNVIVTNRGDQKPMTAFSFGEGDFNKFDDSVSQWIPKIGANTPFFERFRKSYYVNESTLGVNSDWRLLLELPVAPMQKALSEPTPKDSPCC